MTETVPLRGHHLLCLLTYIGRGYSPAFIVSMTAVATRITNGVPITIVEGPDMLCEPLRREGHACAGHCLTRSTSQRDLLALTAVSTLLGQCVQADTQLSLSAEQIQLMRQHFRDEPNFRRACAGCEWHGLCDEVTANGFAATLLFPVKDQV